MKRVFKPLLTSLLAFILTFSFTGNFNRVEASTFKDVGNDYATAAIEKWASYGIATGDGAGTFYPTSGFTRAQMATMLTRIMGYEKEAVNNFTDVPSGDFYESFILRAVEAGVFDAGGAFRPDAFITREESAVAFAKALGLEFPESDSFPSHFMDDNLISAQARGAIKAIVNNKVMQGIAAETSDGRDAFVFKPGNFIQRKDMMLMFDNAIAALLSGTVSNRDYNRTVVINKPGTSLDNVRIAGDLIIGEGVGEGDVFLNNVQVDGQVLVRAGGADSLYINGNSVIKNIKVDKKSSDAEVSIKVSESATVTNMNVANGAVVVTGSNGGTPIISNITLTSSKSVVSIADDVVIGTLLIGQQANGATVTIDGEVANLQVAANNANIFINSENIGSITVSGNNVTITVSPELENVAKIAAMLKNIKITGNNVTLAVSADVMEELEEALEVQGNNFAVVLTEDIVEATEDLIPTAPGVDSDTSTAVVPTTAPATNTGGNNSSSSGDGGYYQPPSHQQTWQDLQSRQYKSAEESMIFGYQEISFIVVEITDTSVTGSIRFLVNGRVVEPSIINGKNGVQYRYAFDGYLSSLIVQAFR